MKKETMNLIITIAIVIVIIAVGILLTNKKAPETEEEVIKCIGSKAVLYTQLGCRACEAQEDLFGENYKYLDVVDCWYNHEPCIDADISATPTWIIKGEKITGVQTIDKLKELTGC